MKTKLVIYSLGVALISGLTLSAVAQQVDTTVRLYRPRKEILDGTWKFPEAQPQ